MIFAQHIITITETSARRVDWPRVFDLHAVNAVIALALLLVVVTLTRKWSR
jgi:hypothetical protein